jgi:DNA-binding beta-propeller fold protein YncE
VNGTDAIVYDSFTKSLFPMSEKITVLVAATGEQVGEVDLGGDPEAGVPDGRGTAYVNIADKKTVAVVDPQTLKVMTTYPIDYCTNPHSLSYDAVNQRLFVGCRDGFAVLDPTNGKVVGRSQMCSGVDSGGFDAENKLIYESCAEGVISVIRQVSPDYYQLVGTVKTRFYAKTMTFDPKTKKIFLPTAEFETIPNTDPKFPYPFERQMKPGTFDVLVVAPN